MEPFIAYNSDGSVAKILTEADRQEYMKKNNLVGLEYNLKDLEYHRKQVKKNYNFIERRKLRGLISENIDRDRFGRKAKENRFFKNHFKVARFKINNKYMLLDRANIKITERIK